MADGIISRDDGYDDENVSTTYSPDPSRDITLTINAVTTINNSSISSTNPIKSGTEILVNITTKNIPDATGYYIRVFTEYDSYNYAFTARGNGKKTFNCQISMQGLRSLTGNLNFVGVVRSQIQTEDSNIINQIYELPTEFTSQNNTIVPVYDNFVCTNSYMPYLDCEKVEFKAERCTGEGQASNIGKYLFLSKLKLKLNSGIIGRYREIGFLATIATKTTSKDVELIIDDANHAYAKNILQTMCDNGYTQELNGISSFHNNLFYNIKAAVDTDDEPIIIDNDTIITLKIQYKYFSDSATSDKRTAYIQNLQASDAYQVLTLIGKTKINNTTQVYGGIAIGQESTVKQKGKPVFECGYPAYFNGQPFGYYPGEILTFYKDVSFSGFTTTGSSGQFSIFLGQPIFSTKVTITGYLTAYNSNRSSYGSYEVQNIKLNSINQRTGIISFAFNTQSYSIYGPTILVPSPYFRLTFQ